MSTNENNNYPPYYKKLNKSEAVERKNFLTLFAIDLRTISIVCEFNHKYTLRTRKVIGPIEIDNWTKFIDKIVKKKLGSPPGIIDSEDIELIQGNLDQEYDNIVDTVLDITNKNKNNNYNTNNGSQQKQEQQNDNLSGTYGTYDRNQDSENGENNKNIIPTLRVLEAVRAPEGRTKVIGKVVSKSINVRVILSSKWHCTNLECKNTGEIIYQIPILHMPKHLDTTTGRSPSC